MTTAKRQKYLDKQKKKLENQRTKEEREVETDKVKKQLKDIGLSTEIEGISKFYKIMDEFVNYGTSAQGIIQLNGFGREICYIFSINKKHEIGVMLRHNPELK